MTNNDTQSILVSMKLSCPNVSQLYRGKERFLVAILGFSLFSITVSFFVTKDVIVASKTQKKLVAGQSTTLANSKRLLTPTLPIIPTLKLKLTPTIVHLSPTKVSLSVSKTLSSSVQPTQQTGQPSSAPHLVFGIGPEADKALQTKLAQEAPVKMLTSWYNGPNDLAWITHWKNDLIPQSYDKGYILHLVTFSDFPEINLQTPYGSACGREYPLSARMLDDMKTLAQTFAGSGQLYVSLFTEFQTYPCEDNTWVGNENYYKTLKDQFRATKQIFKEHAPNAKIGISWGGWISRWDDPVKGAGRSLIPYFDDILKESDFTDFQAMESGTNVEDIRSMSKILGAYGKPIMLSHYKPDNGSQSTFDTDVKAVLTDDFLKEVTGYGLFAYSFMDSVNLDNSENTYQFVKSAVQKYGK